MKKTLLLVLTISSQCCTGFPRFDSDFPKSSEKPHKAATKQSLQTPKPIHFSTPINLFAPRKIAEKIEEKHPKKVHSTIIKWLKQPDSYQILENAIGRQLTQTGHDKTRKESYTGTEIKPNFIVLTSSGKETLSETISILQKNGLAHNFIIDTDGKIYPVTAENETIEQALMHRPYAVGISGRVIDGCNEQRDMNAASITISVIGKNDSKPSEEQYESIITLSSYLKDTYNIRPDQVLDYGCVACHQDGSYGRRNTNPFLPWKEISTYPKEKEIEETRVYFKNESEKAVWTTLALRKIGFICPITNNTNNEHAKKAILAFQQHTQAQRQDGIICDDTIKRLNSMIIQHEQHNPKLKEIQPPSLPTRPFEDFGKYVGIYE